MNKYLFMFSLLLISEASYADQIFSAGTHYSSAFDSECVRVEKDARVYAAGGEDIKVSGMPVYLHNDGVINGRIDTNFNNLYLYNSGEISGGITTENGGSITQIITPTYQSTNFSVVGGNYFVSVENCTNLDFNNIKTLSADSFEIKDSSIVINNFTDWQNWDTAVSFDGPVTLYINNLDVTDDGVLIKHVNNSNNAIIKVNGIDDLHKINLSYEGQYVYLHVVRENSLHKILLNDKRDDLLNEIRKDNANDKLINNLDAANNISEVLSVMNSSYRFNHNILLRPVRVINNFSNLSFISNTKDIGIGAKAFYMASDTADDFGGRFYMSGAYEGLYLNLGLNINNFSFSDNINDFSGAMYGIDMQLNKYFGSLWIDGTLGVGFIKYKADYIYVNDVSIENNPKGYSGYGAFKLGYDYNLFDGFVVAPVVGALYQQIKVIDINDIDVNGIGGAKIGYSFIMDDIKYEYKAYAGVETNTNLFANFEIGFWSVIDAVGAAIDFGILKDEYDFYYKIGFQAKVAF